MSLNSESPGGRKARWSREENRHMLEDATSRGPRSDCALRAKRGKRSLCRGSQAVAMHREHVRRLVSGLAGGGLGAGTARLSGYTADAKLGLSADSVLSHMPRAALARVLAVVTIPQADAQSARACRSMAQPIRHLQAGPNGTGSVVKSPASCQPIGGLR